MTSTYPKTFRAANKISAFVAALFVLVGKKGTITKWHCVCTIRQLTHTRKYISECQYFQSEIGGTISQIVLRLWLIFKLAKVLRMSNWHRQSIFYPFSEFLSNSISSNPPHMSQSRNGDSQRPNLRFACYFCDAIEFGASVNRGAEPAKRINPARKPRPYAKCIVANVSGKIGTLRQPLRNPSHTAEPNEASA